MFAGWIAPGAVAGTAVYVTASFTDRNHLFIEDLSRDEVRILENGEPRKIEFLARDEIPVVYGIVFERDLLGKAAVVGRSRGASGAISCREIAYDLIDKYLGKQAIWVGVYERKLEVIQDTTTDGFIAKRAIQNLSASPERRESFLFGSLIGAVTKMSGRAEKRRVLFLFLDILDVETAGKIDPMKNLLSSSNIELFIVSFASRMSRGRGGLLPQMSQSALRDLVQATAGYAFFSSEYGEHVQDISRRIYNHVRTFYTFGFEASSKIEGPGSLTIECARPGSKVRNHPTVPIPIP